MTKGHSFMHRKGKGYLFFHNAKNQHNLRVATLVTFILLAIEKLFTGSVAAYESGKIQFTLALSLHDVACILIYLAVAVLLAARVRYKYLLIPDFFLLAIKLYDGVKSFFKLITLYPSSSAYQKLDMAEKATESFLFSLFLVLLFVGKLMHTRRVYSKNYPFVCMRLLIACFPITVAFEILKAVMHLRSGAGAFPVFFLLSENILNEAFLDLPYFLLLMLMAFIPERRH